MKKKRIPAMIFNNSDYKYPKGLKITDEDELDIKLKSREWNTGPVDGKSFKIKDKSVESKKELTDDEKRELIQKLQDELPKSAPDKSAPDKSAQGKNEKQIESESNDETPKQKALSHMNITELLNEAKIIGIAVDEDWTKTQLYKAISKKKG